MRPQHHAVSAHAQVVKMPFTALLIAVVKIMRPVKEHRLRRELKILSLVRGGPNIVSFKEVVRDPDTKTPCFVFELVDAMSFRELQASVSDLDVR